jgi:hypothetical protein
MEVQFDVSEGENVELNGSNFELGRCAAGCGTYGTNRNKTIDVISAFQVRGAIF